MSTLCPDQPLIPFISSHSRRLGQEVPVFHLFISFLISFDIAIVKLGPYA